MRKHCLYISHSWVFICLHHGMSLKEKPLALIIQNGLAMRLFSSRGREQTYSLVKPGPPLAKARFLNSVQIFCNCVDWREQTERTPKPSFYIISHTYVFKELEKGNSNSFSHYTQALKHTSHFMGCTNVKTSTCISLGPNTLINLSSLFLTSCMLG